MVRHGSVVHVGLQHVGRVGRIGGILYIVVGIHLTAPQHGVDNHGGVVDIDSGTAAIASALDDDVGTRTLVAHHRTVVHLSTLIQEHTSAFGRRRVVRHHAAGHCGIETFHAGYTFSRKGCAAAYAGRVVVNQRVEHLAVSLHTDTSAVTGHDAQSQALVGMQIAIVHFTSAVQIETAASAGRFVLLYDAVFQLCPFHHVGSAAKGIVLAVVLYSAVASTSAFDGEAVHQGRAVQRLGASVLVKSVGRKPYHVVGVARKGGVVGLLLGVPRKGGRGR